MRQLTFKGYLESYVAYLSGRKTTSLTELASLVDSNARLRAPLVLWAVKSKKADRLAGLLGTQKSLTVELTRLAELEAQGTLEEQLAEGGAGLRTEHLKVWRSYVARRDAHLRDDGLKLQARKRVLQLEAQRPVTRYRMAKDLGLNPGNLHAFLSQGNVKKLSLPRAYQLVEYLETSGSSMRSHDERCSASAASSPR